MTEKDKSLYDVIKRRLRQAQRQTYLHRLIYIGQHNFRHYPTIKQFFEDIIQGVNTQDPDELLSGFLLHYEKIFIHIVEGSQATILRHVRRIFTAVDKSEAQLQIMKVLIACHNINKRFFNNWAGRTARPPTLLGEISPDSDLETTWKQVKTCIMKINKLSAFIQQHEMDASIDHLSELVPHSLPEIGLLKFLLGCQLLLDLRDYINTYFYISHWKSYQELIWPVQEDLVPYNLLVPDENVFLCDMEIVKPEISESLEIEPPA